MLIKYYIFILYGHFKTIPNVEKKKKHRRITKHLFAEFILMLINKPFNFPTFINFSQQFQFAYDIDTNDEYSIER